MAERPTTESPEPSLVEEKHPGGMVSRRFSLRDGRLDGVMETFDEAGRPLARMNFRNGVLHGPALLFQAGRPVAELAYADGKMDGEVKNFDPAGRLIAVTPFKAGVKQGLGRVFRPDGSLMRTESYADNELDGETVDFHPNGAVQRRGRFVRGLADGEALTYDPTGKPLERVVYRAGQQLGPVEVVRSKRRSLRAFLAKLKG